MYAVPDCGTDQGVTGDALTSRLVYQPFSEKLHACSA